MKTVQKSLASPIPCPRCTRDVRVPWLIAILYSPSEPARIVGFCASRAAELRYASPARQRAICEEISLRAYEREVA